MEVDIHVGSSVVANNITGVGRRASSSLHIDMGYALEGRSEDELPERVSTLICHSLPTFLFSVYLISSPLLVAGLWAIH